LAISSKRKGKSGGILMYQKSTNVALFALEKAFKVIEAKSKIQD
jgi:hypothetical protein